MTNDQVNAVLRGLVEHFKPLPAERLDPKETWPSSAEARQHARWMAEEALSWEPERLEKKMRWLGFIQAVVWLVDGVAIETLKQDNMSA